MPTSSRDAEPLIDQLVIVGVGLIGGSIARAAASRGVARRTIGLGRNRERLAAAQAAGVIDAVATSVAELPPFDLAVVCTPVDRIAADVRAVLAAASSSSLVTDAGSVKGTLCRELADLPQFIGAHPMAGSEHGGWEHSHADLFVGKTCAITPLEQRAENVAIVTAFWRRLGMKTIRFTPEQHDQMVAMSSHLPHVAASAVATQLAPAAWPLASSGFHDTTRVASGDSQLWTAILRDNREAVAEQVQAVIRNLQGLQQALESGSSDQIHDFLEAGRRAREAWLAHRESLG